MICTVYTSAVKYTPHLDMVQWGDSVSDSFSDPPTTHRCHQRPRPPGGAGATGHRQAAVRLRGLRAGRALGLRPCHRAAGTLDDERKKVRNDGEEGLQGFGADASKVPWGCHWVCIISGTSQELLVKNRTTVHIIGFFQVINLAGVSKCPNIGVNGPVHSPRHLNGPIRRTLSSHTS